MASLRVISDLVSGWMFRWGSIFGSIYWWSYFNCGVWVFNGIEALCCYVMPKKACSVPTWWIAWRQRWYQVKNFPLLLLAADVSVPFVILSFSIDHSGDFFRRRHLSSSSSSEFIGWFPCLVVPRLVPIVCDFIFQGFRVSCGPLMSLWMLWQWSFHHCHSPCVFGLGVIIIISKALTTRTI